MVKLLHDIDDEKYWNDGLKAALPLLEGDATLVWTGSNGKHLKSLTGNEIWLFAGGSPIDYGVTTVVEDKYAQREFEKIGVKASIAFGVNTNLFKPQNLEKKWQVIFPAAFAKWKRHSLLIDWVKEAGIPPEKVLCVGYKQQVETECYTDCEKAGFEVRDRVTPEELAIMYNQSIECWIPTETIGGSQRTLMEAMACGLKVRVAQDNPRLVEMLMEPIKSHYEYAERLNGLIAFASQRR